MRKLLLVLAVGFLASGCVFGVGLQSRRGFGAGVQVGHAHCRGCGHVFVNGVWIVAR
jgi:hypothetical protein